MEIIKKQRKRDTEVKYLKQDELKKFFSVIEKSENKFWLRDLTAFQVIYYCGLRASELQKRKEITITKVIKSIVSSKQSDYTAITINDSHYKKKEVYMHKKGTVLENGEIVFLEHQRDTQSIGASIINDAKNRYEILWHIHSHTHIDFDWIKSILTKNKLEWKAIVDKVSNDNNYLSFIIDEICKNYYTYQEEVTTKQEVLQIIRKEIWSFQFEVDAQKLEHKPKLIVYQQDNSREKGNRLWFHLNPYNFDSSDELDLFEHIRSKLKEDEQIKDI